MVCLTACLNRPSSYMRNILCDEPASHTITSNYLRFVGCLLSFDNFGSSSCLRISEQSRSNAFSSIAFMCSLSLFFSCELMMPAPIATPIMLPIIIPIRRPKDTRLSKETIEDNHNHLTSFQFIQQRRAASCH